MTAHNNLLFLFHVNLLHLELHCYHLRILPFVSLIFLYMIFGIMSMLCPVTCQKRHVRCKNTPLLTLKPVTGCVNYSAFALFSAIYDNSRNAVLNTAKIRRYIGIIHIPMPCCSFPNSIGMKVLPT